jgi:cyclohexyl-isocyanide hydratase
MDQADFTGPFEVLSRVPDSQFHILAKDPAPVRDARGLVLTPEKPFSEAPQLDLILVPGGAGVNALMQDTETLEFLQRQAMKARYVMSVCTGALVLGAAGLLRGRQATTHWASHHMLQHLGAIPVNSRVVIDGNIVTTAGVTAGYDGALRVAALLRGETAAQEIQLYLQYSPEPPFNSGNPESAPPEVLLSTRNRMRGLLDERLEIIKRITARES